MKRKLKQWFSVQRAKNPGNVVLGMILLFNIVFFFVAAAIISALSLDGTEHMGFIEAAFCTLPMILDAGCIQFVVADIGEAGVLITLFCLCVVLTGMISFTGAVIGYVTNYISHFIENANEGKHRIYLSNHVVLLNWNSRASEIVNDFLFSGHKQHIVVLVSSRKDEVKRELEERLSDTVERENRKRMEPYKNRNWLVQKIAYFRYHFRNNLTVLVREGDVFSSKQLQDISLERARSIIILGNDINNTICKFEHREWADNMGKGNSQTIKTLMQVAEITSKASSNDNQKIIVEITDEYTWELAAKIIRTKQVDGKCNIVPVRVNQILGQILSQFSLMPELNRVYEELFSNKGVEVYSMEQPYENVTAYAKRFLQEHRHAIPLAFMISKGKNRGYCVAEDAEDIPKKSAPVDMNGFSVAVNRNYWMERKSVVILGHNSKSRDIMQGFASFCSEWNRDGQDIVNIVVIDDKKNLDKMNHYREYSFVTETVEADVFDEDLICSTIERVVSQSEEDTSILILSDDSVLNEDIDANALAHLIYVQEIINRKKKDPAFDPGSIDVIVEIIDPKHHDIVGSYSVNNVVISNRYISKMVAQIGEVDALFDFYTDILSYDDMDLGAAYSSKEIYIKKVSRFFREAPEECTAGQLIRALLVETTREELPPEERDPAFALGYVKRDGTILLFGGDQQDIPVKLEMDDKLIVFSSH